MIGTQNRKRHNDSCGKTKRQKPCETTEKCGKRPKRCSQNPRNSSKVVCFSTQNAPNIPAGPAMPLQTRTDASESDSAGRSIFFQQEQCLSTNAVQGEISQGRTNEGAGNLSASEAGKEHKSKPVKKRKTEILQTIAKSLIFATVVLIALAPPVSTLVAIIIGFVYGFSWTLAIVPLFVWVLTGALTMRLMIHKTDITFKR